MIHSTSEVQTKSIGDGTQIWQYCVILKEAIIGKNCNINFNVFIENWVKIGDNVTVKSGVQIWDGITIEDDVFIGPNVTFTNDVLPRSKQYFENFKKTLIKEGASIGANATIIAGNKIAKYAMVGAGSVVTKSIGKNELWVGNPAKHVGYITDKGDLLDMNLKSKSSSQQYKWLNEQIVEEND